MENLFGSHFAKLRLGLGLTLRQFCLTNKLDPGNVSKIERGLMAPPHEPKALAKYAKALGLKADTPEWNKFNALAGTTSGKIPAGVLSDKEAMSQLPVLFMALGEKKPNAARLKKIIKLVRES